jgi:hypothetical protein
MNKLSFKMISNCDINRKDESNNIFLMLESLENCLILSHLISIFIIKAYSEN